MRACVRFYTVGNDRVRVSYDSAGAVTECIVKEKLQHLDFWYDPKHEQSHASVAGGGVHSDERKSLGDSFLTGCSVACLLCFLVLPLFTWRCSRSLCSAAAPLFVTSSLRNGKPKCIDFRISANRERRVELPTGECDQLRRKDRLSYRFDLFALELTKVDLFNNLTRGEPTSERPTSTTFEVEVEVKEMAYLRAEAAKVRAGVPNDFVRVATALLETMRTLAQYALPNQLPPGWKPLTPSPAAIAAAAAAAQNKKRPREEEEQPRQEYGKAWS